MRRYTAKVWREGKFWVVTVDGLPMATQARNAREVMELTKDFIASLTEQPESSFEVEYQFDLPAEVTEALQRAEHLQREAEVARKAAASEARRAARALKDSGLSLRDVGFALGISFQRAHQLIQGD